jgi:hypothetical protein
MADRDDKNRNTDRAGDRNADRTGDKTVADDENRREGRDSESL